MLFRRSNDTGKKGEAIAVGHLKKKGYKILATNYRTSQAEIDIVADDGGDIVFVEVKSSRYEVASVWQVDERKRKSILKAADKFLYTNRKEERPVRFEIVAVNVSTRTVRHFTEEFFDS